MSVRREKSFDRLAKAMREASNNRGGTAGNNDAQLRALTEEYLRKGNESERRELLRRYRAGDSLKGENGIRRALAAMDMAAPTYPTTFLGPRRSSTRSWIRYGARAC